MLPKDAPHSPELEVHQTVADALANFDIDQSEQIIERMVRAAVGKAQEPWKRRKKIEKLIEQARNQLGYGAMRAAAGRNRTARRRSPLAEIRAAAVEAGDKVRAEYEAWKANEDHR